MPNKRGFTLVEILVAITIIGLVSVLAIPNLRKFNEDQILTDTSNDLVRVLKQAQSSSMSGIQCAGVASTSWELSVTSTGYSLVCKNATGSDTTYTKTISELTITCNTPAESPPFLIRFNKNEINTDKCGTSSKYEIKVTKSGIDKKITIDKGGSISN